MPKIKISQLPAKAANLAATDLLEVSEVSGLTYVSKKITGAELVGNRVPYTGATSDVDLGEYELKAGQIELDQSPTGTAGVAVTRWNDSIGLTETTLKGGSVIIKNGVDLVARVVNKVTPNTTLTKAAYPVVKISGAQGQRLAVDYAQANNDNNSADTLGVVTETIATNQEGFIMTVGQLEGVNTSGSLQGETWLDGDVLYLSPTVPGAVTKVKPTGATGHIVVIGYVEHAHNVNGKIYVKIMNGWELDELHNVYINQATLANNDALIYESSTQLWKNNPVTESVLSLSDVTTNNVSITKHGFAPKLPNDASKFLDGTGNYTSPPTGLTVGTTAVTSGTNGRVFFQEGGVIQQDANFTYNSTQKRLTLKAVGTAATDIPFAVQNSTGTRNNLTVNGAGLTTSNVDATSSYIWTNHFQAIRYESGNAITNVNIKTNYPFVESFYIGRSTGTANNDASTASGFMYSHNGEFTVRNGQTGGYYGITLNCEQNLEQRVGIDTGRTGFGLGWSLRNFTNSVDVINFATNSPRVGIGWNNKGAALGAILDVKAQGALSTDIAFRVRNSADTQNLFSQDGTGSWIYRNNAGNRFFTWDGGTNYQYGIVGGFVFSIDVSSGGATRLDTTADVLLEGTSTHKFLQYKNGNFQLEEASGIAQTSGAGGFSMKNATTIPSASSVDRFIMYSTDITAGNAAPHFRTESGDVIKLYKNAAVTTPQGIADALTNLGVLTASTIAPSVQSVVSAATVTPVNGNDLVKITAQAAALTLANPTGVWPEGKDLMIRIKDDGLGARAITWDTNYRAIGVTLPTTTVLGKTTYVGVIYNSDDAKWDVIGVTTQA